MRRYCVLFTARSNGAIIADSCQAIEDQTGEWPLDFPKPEIDETLEDVWEYYWQLRRATAGGVNGPQPISFTEIQAWATLCDIMILPQEIEDIRLLDDHYLYNTYEINNVKKRGKRR